MDHLKSKSFLVNQGIRQGCSVSPTLFNIYLDDALRVWKRECSDGIHLGNGNYVNTLLFADDQVLIARNENELQKNAHILSNILEDYNLKISIKKSKVMSFQGKYPVRSKICIYNSTLEQVRHFNYLGCDLSYDYENDIDIKLHRFQQMCGTIRRTLSKKTRRETQLKMYKVMAVPVLLYGSESWVLTRKKSSNIQASEMRFLRAVKGCSLLDQLRNENIRNDLNIFSIVDKIKEKRSAWSQHIQRMEDDRLTKVAYHYRPTGKRDPGRPRQRWNEAGTGLLA